MSRKLKMICVACVAVFALTAVSASSAMATTSGFTVGTGGTVIKGTQTTAQKLTLGETVAVKCTTSTLNAPVTAGLIHSATATPTYSGCSLGGVTANIDLNSCTYLITDTETANTYNADLTNCPSTAPLKITVPSTECEITISNQGPLMDIDAANNSTKSPDDVDATLTIKGIDTFGNEKCPVNVRGTKTNGELTGGYTLQAFNSSGVQVTLTTD